MIQPGFVRNNINQFAIVYRLVDLSAILFSMMLASSIFSVAPITGYLQLGMIAGLCYMFCAESCVLYRSWRADTFMQLTFYVLLSWLGMLLIGLGFLFITKTTDDYSRATLTSAALGSLGLLLGWRALFRLFLSMVRAEGINTRSVGVIGLTPTGQRLISEIQDHSEIGYKLKAVYDDRTIDRIPQNENLDLLRGDIELAIKTARKGALDVLFIAIPLKAEDRIKDILKRLGDTTVEVHLVPDFFMFNLLHARMKHIGSIQTVSVYDTPMKGAATAVKRLEDILLSLMILTLIAIPMVLIAIGVKLSSPGPVIFKQFRYGMDGKKIKVWKFRSMTVTENSNKVVQARKGDARVTPFGAFIRKTSLDELPQFINVLQGQMSVVGPRPHAVAHNEQYRKIVAYYMLRHKMKPGITGWAQINGWRGETDTLDKMKMRIQYDLEYIRHWSIWMDVKIVFLTLFKGFVGKNVY